MPKVKILIVDDDKDFQEVLIDDFDETGLFDVTPVYTADHALEMLKQHHFDLILLDVQLPGMNGIEALLQIRSGKSTIPVIMLTGMDDFNNEVQGINCGANDYITKPFEFSVLLARIQLHLRNYATSDLAVNQIGSLVFRPGEKSLSDTKGNSMRLTEKEVSILKVLYGADGKKVDRNVLLEQVWGYGPDISTHTLVTHIHRLRKKIDEFFGDSSFLVTVEGGYKLAY